ncbi:cation diffusion facilitator family transporter [Radiobacillus kanasensis]|uniref:cation diffusion facilitator family transporter n=1 Tax=Radiobacillus kanasensis TaxID=2844358 RepID=UPI001E3FD956|nr:cation diffusion facilitator family transporter [Radiobacillus kanasensis]UFT99677.1 cation diffusion facilitator family transporter [Radiobacillus kanasensis]
MGFFHLLKKGNKSALIAAIVNTIISAIKGVAFFITGNVAMFAETMHSLGDAANQFFVFIGSALSKRPPSRRFPNGFGRLVNLVLLGAVLIVGIMSYETVKEGILHIMHPVESTGFLINISVLGTAVLLELYVLYKAMKEIAHEVGSKATGLQVVTDSFSNYRKAKPATKLVFMEDSVATLGGVLAIIAIVISQYTGFHQAEGIASVLIGAMMFYVVGRVFLDNAAGVLGEADYEMQNKIGTLLMKDPDVRDIPELAVMKEGEELHVEVIIEVDPNLTIEKADDIKDRLEAQIMEEQGVTDVIIEYDENDGISKWKETK